MAEIEMRPWIARADLRAEPAALFIFGDNLARIGLGGQAKAMRGEPNAVGLPTKRSPWVFFTDKDLGLVMVENLEPLERLRNHLLLGRKLVVPLHGIGTGLAELRQHAPLIALYYDTVMLLLGVK